MAIAKGGTMRKALGAVVLVLCASCSPLYTMESQRKFFDDHKAEFLEMSRILGTYPPDSNISIYIDRKSNGISQEEKNYDRLVKIMGDLSLERVRTFKDFAKPKGPDFPYVEDYIFSGRFGEFSERSPIIIIREVKTDDFTVYYNEKKCEELSEPGWHVCELNE
ncbi:hypothetical protein [Aestuariivirga sp.]|uniref:hypothetical protein n=1 Tax=Aestuariivirga sp. TaxID=2650926 RepID=UPI0039E50CF8